jgi:ABC-2 type transport system permease protein/lipopolysaccharide transport system permease protein
VLFYPGPFGHWKWQIVTGLAAVLVFFFGYFLFDRLRDSFAEEV